MREGSFDLGYYLCNMSRLLSIDYGTKKCGLAVTDPLQIIVNGLETVSTSHLEQYLKDYCRREVVSDIIIGLPRHPDGNPAQLAPEIERVALKLRQLIPSVNILTHDESYTTKHAKQIILKSGLSKKKRRDKALIDKVSAVLILQDYLAHI